MDGTVTAVTGYCWPALLEIEATVLTQLVVRQAVCPPENLTDSCSCRSAGCSSLLLLLPMGCLAS